VAYRERQKLPALQQKLLQLFGCSSTAVLCAAAEEAARPLAEDLGTGTPGQKRSLTSLWAGRLQLAPC
jgi:hypothetical protein